MNDTKKKELLSDEDALFCIHSSKNQARRENPTPIPTPTILPSMQREKEEQAKKEQEKNALIADENPTKNNRKRVKTSDYEDLFLTSTNISTRRGKAVSIREIYHKRIAMIIQRSDDSNISIFSYIDHVLEHHFETFKSEIQESLRQNPQEDDYFSK